MENVLTNTSKPQSGFASASAALCLKYTDTDRRRRCSIRIRSLLRNLVCNEDNIKFFLKGVYR